MKRGDFIDLANNILIELSKHKIYGYIYHIASTTNSVYIKFANSLIGSVRVSDHIGYARYNYRFNIGPHIEKYHVKKADNVVRFFYNTADFSKLIYAIKKRNKESENWKSCNKKHLIYNGYTEKDVTKTIHYEI